MAEAKKNSISARLWRLPGQFLVALINATAILTIIAALLALIALSRLQSFGESVASSMTDAVLARVVPEPREALAGLSALRAEVQSLSAILKDRTVQGDLRLEGNIERVQSAVTALKDSIDRLTTAKTQLTDETLGQSLAATITALTGRNLYSTATDGPRTGQAASAAAPVPRAAHLVVDIIQRAKPQDLPVELPTKYDLQINLKTAKALGLVVPQSVLLAATEIFE